MSEKYCTKNKVAHVQICMNRHCIVYNGTGIGINRVLLGGYFYLPMPVVSLSGSLLTLRDQGNVYPLTLRMAEKLRR